MRHADAATFERLAGLLASLRAIEGLKEPRTGAFSHGGRAVLHFHDDGDRLYCDVRLVAQGSFERREVTTRAQQRALVTEVRAALRGA